MRYLILGDLHNQIDAADIALEENKKEYDQAIFTGDYFDSFYDSNEVMSSTCKWLKKKLSDDTYQFCLGNHDICYLFGNSLQNIASGYSLEKNEVFLSIFKSKKDIRNINSRLRPCVLAGGWIVSHAGFTNKWVDTNKEKYKLDTSTAMLFVETVNSAYDSEIYFATHEINFVSSSRGGKDLCAGPLWVDFYKDFEADKSLKFLSFPQIVGHTSIKQIDTRDNTLNVDTQFNQGVIVDDESKEYKIINFSENVRKSAKTFLKKCRDTQIINLLMTYDN